MSLKIERSPRLIEHLNVDIKNIKDGHLNALTSNVSIGGFAIQCSMKERIQLTPQGDLVDDVMPVDVNLQLQNQHGEKDPIHARCRVIYSRRIAQDKCQIGMSFIEFQDEGHVKLAKFIQNIQKLQ